MKTTDIMARLQAKYPLEKEYLQAVQEVLESIEDVYNQHPEFEKAKIVERIVEPDRIFTFRVTWIDDKGEVQTNTGYRIQFNSAIGPYKGGLRFHKAVTPSMLKFLGFEQTFKNALTTRLGLDVSAYKIGTMGVSGKVEADFYNLSGSVPILRLRQAYMKLDWDNSPLSLTIGQTWHPMAADLPHMNNLESGAPFNPFNRSPQLTADVKLGSSLTLTASILYLNHYLPTGPAGKSKDYYKYGLPEAYVSPVPTAFAKFPTASPTR